MNISIVYDLVMLFIFCIGLRVLSTVDWGGGNAYVKFRRHVLILNHVKVKAKIGKHMPSRDMLQDSGLNISLVQYNGFRLLTILLVLLIAFYKYMGSGVLPHKQLLFVLAFTLLTEPVAKVFGYATPFGVCMQALKKMRQEQIDKELFNSMTQLKNLCIAQADMPLSGDFLIEQLMKSTRITKEAYSKLLTLWRLGKDEEGCTLFAQMLNTKMSHELSKIFMKLDHMNPAELVTHLELYQNHLREERMTAYLRKQENMSYVLYAPVIASAFMILLNFVIVVVWLDTMQMMKNI